MKPIYYLDTVLIIIKVAYNTKVFEAKDIIKTVY